MIYQLYIRRLQKITIICKYVKNSINGCALTAMALVVHLSARWRYSHDNPGMVLHDGVVQVEPSEVHEGCALPR